MNKKEKKLMKHLEERKKEKQILQRKERKLRLKKY